MDTREMVEQITREVLARLKEGGAQPVSGQPASGGAKDASGSQPASSGAPLKAGFAPLKAGFAQASLARYIDHTLLKPESTQAQVDKLCAEAIEYKFYSVCVNSTWVAQCARKLRGTGVKVCAVVGFPLGAMDSRAKNLETRYAVENGASEIDMVINVGALKSGDLKTVEEDMRAVLRACRQTTVMKVIIECALLTDAEKVLACQIAKKAGAQFVKTSTGFAASGATVQDVALMRRTVGPELGVKAAGGIRSTEDALAMIQAGATRLGTSAGIAIVTGTKSSSKY